ncbi:MAG: hypothetical protein JXA06_07750 [Bacteroidetes bacterium]|nr:hypothetical protein [Bacteroidota bacterium]
MTDTSAEELTLKAVLQELQVSNILRVMKMISNQGELIDKKLFETRVVQAKSILRELKK